MENQERRELIEMRQMIQKALIDTNDLLLVYPPDKNDADFMFLVKKAIMYRDSLTKIDELLNE
jgi:hypothetical protein